MKYLEYLIIAILAATVIMYAHDLIKFKRVTFRCSLFLNLVAVNQVVYEFMSFGFTTQFYYSLTTLLFFALHSFAIYKENER